MRRFRTVRILPRAILEMRGTISQKHQKLRNEPKPIPGAPDCPEHLGPEHRVIWDQVIQALSVADILCKTDFGVVERYCVMLHQWRALQKCIDVEHIASEKNLLTLSLKLDSALKSLEGELALSPSARAKIGSVPRKATKSGKTNYFDEATA